MMNFALKTRNFVSKKRNFVFKMMIFAVDKETERVVGTEEGAF